MFEDSFLINLVIFVVGQVAAYGYLRTGRMGRGIALIAVCWTLADIALLEAVVHERKTSLFRWCLLGMQIYSVIEVVLFALGRIRRRFASVRERRDLLFRRAYMHYLKNELELARDAYRALVRRDGWDLESKLGLATVLARQGQARKARSLFRAARHLDLRHEYSDPIADELARCDRRRRARVATPASREGAEEATAASPTGRPATGRPATGRPATEDSAASEPAVGRQTGAATRKSKSKSKRARTSK